MDILPPIGDEEPTRLPAIPILAQWVLLRYLEPILAWLSAWVYARARPPDHPLVRLARSFDLDSLVGACAAYHHAHGPGAPPTYPVAVLVRCELVRLWAGSCSDPALERLLTTDLVARGFVGLGLWGPTPDHSTLNRFHAWLGQHQPERLFGEVLRFLARVDPEDPARTPQVLDTFGLESPAAPTPPALTLLKLTARLLDHLDEHAPPTLRPLVPDLDRTPLRRPPRLRLPDQQAAQLQEAVQVVQQVEAALTPHRPALDPALRQTVEGHLAVLHKVIADDLTLDEAGQWVEKRNEHKGSYRLASATDLQATFRKHGHETILGYNAAVAATATRITAAVVVTGSTPDSETVVPLLQQQREAERSLPPQVVMDRAGGWGQTRSAVSVVSGGQTEMVARIPPAGGADPDRFGPIDFTLSADGLTCTCPQGRTTDKHTDRPDTQGVTFRFTATMCRDCPLWDRCREADANPKAPRTVFKSPYDAYLTRARAFNATAAGQALLKSRSRIEPLIAWLVRYDGARRSRRVGRTAAQFHLFQACAWRNLMMWLSRVRRGLAPPPPVLPARREVG